jgi:protein tyrosine phosphatase (PTP) superfamily phosphohydrolase (DUF442 family)
MGLCAMSLSEIIQFTPLDTGLWTAGQPTAEQLAELALAGVQLVINLAVVDSDRALPDEIAIVTRLGMHYIHIPVVWDAPQLADLHRFMDTLEAHADEKIFVHCALNYRASAFVALWRVLRHGWAPAEAFAVQRQIWKLEEYPIWQAFVSDALKTQ